jgi:hypothetical protein
VETKRECHNRRERIRCENIARWEIGVLPQELDTHGVVEVVVVLEEILWRSIQNVLEDAFGGDDNVHCSLANSQNGSDLSEGWSRADHFGCEIITASKIQQLIKLSRMLSSPTKLDPKRDKCRTYCTNYFSRRSLEN